MKKVQGILNLVYFERVAGPTGCGSQANFTSLGYTDMRAFIYILVIVMSFSWGGGVQACSFIYVPQKYINVLKVSGPKLDGVEFYEAVYGIGFYGKNAFKIYSADRRLLVTRVAGSVCVYDTSSDKYCYKDQDSYVPLKPFMGSAKANPKTYLYIQVNDSDPIKYSFKEKRVRSTKEHHRQLEAEGWSECYETT